MVCSQAFRVFSVKPRMSFSWAESRACLVSPSASRLKCVDTGLRQRWFSWLSAQSMNSRTVGDPGLRVHCLFREHHPAQKGCGWLTRGVQTKSSGGGTESWNWFRKGHPCMYRVSVFYEWTRQLQSKKTWWFQGRGIFPTRVSAAGG